MTRPTFVLELLNFHFTIVVMLSKIIVTGKKMNMLAYTPVETNFLQTVAKTSINPGRETILSKKTF